MHARHHVPSSTKRSTPHSTPRKKKNTSLSRRRLVIEALEGRTLLSVGDGSAGLLGAEWPDAETALLSVQATPEATADPLALTLTVAPGSFSESAGSGAATGTVTRSGATTEALTVNLLSDDTSEATVGTTVSIEAGQASATFPVAAVDDADADGTRTVTITASATGYADGTATVQVTDDEPVVTVVAADANAGEPANSATFHVVRTGATSTALVVNFAVSGIAARGVDYRLLQGNTEISGTTLTIPAGQDALDLTLAVSDDTAWEGSETAILTLADGTGYAVGTAANATATLADDDWLLASSATLAVPEGTSTTFTIKLASAPTEAVTVGIAKQTGGDTDLGATPATLTFTPANWDQAQTVNVAAAEDADAVGGTAGLVVSMAGAADVTVTATEADNDLLVASPTTQMVPKGGAAHFSVKLAGQPAEPLTVSITKKPGGDADTVTTPASLTFTPENWETAQTVTVTGLDQATVFEVVAPGQIPRELSVAVYALVPSSATLSVPEGDSASFTLKLSAQPPADVTVTVAKQAGGDADLTAAPATLTFTTANWAAPQTVTVSAAQDADVANGAASLLISSAELVGITVTATEAEDDLLVVTPKTMTAREGESASFTVKLAAAPVGNRTVTIRKQAEGDADLNLSTEPTTLTFTPSNWETPQTVTIAAAEDADPANGTASFVISSDGLVDATVAATEADDDWLIVAPLSQGVSKGHTAEFSVKLAAQPAADTTVAIAKQAGGDANAAATPASLVFTTTNWATPQTVAVSALEATTIFTVSAAGQDPVATTIAVFDLLVDSTTLSVPEGNTASFTVKLTAAPVADVTVGVGKPAEGDADLTATPAALTFTTANWDTPQTVTVAAAQDDDAANGTADFAVSSAGLTTITVAATEADDDWLVVTPSTLTVAEGAGALIAVKLAVQPTANVTVTVAKQAGEGVDGDPDIHLGTDPTVLTFTPVNWNKAQSVPVGADADEDSVNGEATFVVSSPGLSSRTVTVTEADASAVNHRPILAKVPDQSMPHTQDELTVQLIGADSDPGTTLTYAAVVLERDPMAQLAWELDQKLGLYSVESYHQNDHGAQERWMRGAGRWYCILPNGELHLWDGTESSATAASSLVATFNSVYYDTPWLLHDAPQPGPSVTAQDIAVSVDSETGLLSVKPGPGYVGTIHVRATVGDGLASDSRVFRVSVTNAAPILVAPKDQSMPHSQDVLTVQLVGSDPDPNETLTYSALVIELDSMAQHAWEVDQQLGLYSVGSYYQNEHGAGERWMRGNDRWYCILPNGELHLWDGTESSATSAESLVAKFDKTYYDTPSLLHDAVRPSSSDAADEVVVSVDAESGLLTINPAADFLGSFHVRVTLSDGIASQSRVFQVSVLDAAPMLASPGDRSMPHTQEEMTIQLVGADPDPNETVTYSAVVMELDPMAQLAGELDQRLGLYSVGSYYQNDHGAEERWMRGDGRWYCILPDGEVHLWDGNESSLHAADSLVAKFDPLYYDKPSLLHDAQVLGNTEQAEGFQLTVDEATGLLTVGHAADFVGTVHLRATLSDGLVSDSKVFSVSVTNAAPALAQPGAKTVAANQDTLTVQLVGTDSDPGETLSYSGGVLEGDPLAQRAWELDQQVELYSVGSYYQNDHGAEERWMRGSGRWYCILPNGEVHLWDGNESSLRAPSSLVAQLSKTYYDTPGLLHDAIQPGSAELAGQVTLNVASQTGLLTLTRTAGFAGTVHVRATVSDGIASHSQVFATTFLGEQPPQSDDPSAQTLLANASILAARDGAGDAAALHGDALRPVAQAAIGRWAAAGLDAAALGAMQNAAMVVTDLPDNCLGMAVAGIVYIDSDAAGIGWFVDPTPAEDEEFAGADRHELLAITGEAAGRMDLLSVVQHELGHVAGLSDLPADSDNVMSGELGAGLRRNATADEPAEAAAPWRVAGTEQFVPQATDSQNAIAVLGDARRLPDRLELQTTFQVDAAANSRWSNALVLFDYHSPTDFKFAGAFVGVNELAIGRMTRRGYVLDAVVRQRLEAGRDYRLEVRLDGAQASLALDGVERLTKAFADELQEGKLGLLSWNGSARFADLVAGEIRDPQ